MSAYKLSSSRPLMITTALLVIGTFTAIAVNPFAKARVRAQVAKDLNKGRMIKITLDVFAADFDGAYPSEELANDVAENLPTKTSNDLFRQLHLAGIADSEDIFWVKGASVCKLTKPDNIIKKGKRPIAAEILKPGDCGWAYLTDQVNTDTGSRPIVMSAFEKGTKSFDKKLYGGKVIVIRLDGSAHSLPQDPKKGQVIDKNGQDVLSPKSDPWKGSTVVPAKILLQPQPAAPVKVEGLGGKDKADKPKN